MGPQALERIVGQDPQLPQGFYPVTEGVRFLPGDQLTVTCEFDSMSRNRPHLRRQHLQGAACASFPLFSCWCWVALLLVNGIMVGI